MTFSYGSVCSGIEAASVAWEPLGWRPAWFAEIEPFPAAVLAHRFPHVPNLGDMTKIAGHIRAGLIDAPDVLVGGTPCQAFSVAGVRAGLADPRGQLTLSYADLANAIDEQRPGNECVIYWENVPGVLSDRTNAFGCFLALLAGEDVELEPEPRPAAGKNSAYWKWDQEQSTHTPSWPHVGCVFGPQRSIAWRILDAQYFGVAQRRRRVFVVASARKGFDPAKLLFESDGVRRDTAPRRETREDVTHDVAPCLTSSGRGVERTDDTRGQDPVIACSNPEGATGLPFLTASNIGKTVNNQTPLLAMAYAFQPRIARNGRGDMGDLVNALTAQAGEDGRGDAAPCVAAIAWSEELTAHIDLAGTIQRGGSGGRHDGVMQTNMAVRRLTPRECERLQGFPDGHTDIPWTEYQRMNRRAAKHGVSFEAELRKRGSTLRGPEKNECPDGPRYKALGNSMAVPCMRWLGERLILAY